MNLSSKKFLYFKNGISVKNWEKLFLYNLSSFEWGPTKPLLPVLESQMMDIVDMAIQVGGAREGESFVLKI
jgi:hypothetical protein